MSERAAPTTDWDTLRRLSRSINARLDEELAPHCADPQAMGREAAGMKGLDFFRRWLGDELPPPPRLGVLFGMEWLDIGAGRAVLAARPTDWMLNPFLGVVHGGVIATLLDTALGAAVHTTLPPATGYATTDLQVRYLRAARADGGRVVATATVVHSGRRHASVEGRVEEEDGGKLLATASAGCAILSASS